MKLGEWIDSNLLFFSKKELDYLIKGLCDVHFIDLTLELKPQALICLNTCLNRRKTGEPLSKILQIKPFWKYFFKTNSFTLDPRPETEFLLEKVNVKTRSVLELGVGTGCIILSILKDFKKAKGTGVDISLEALKIAEENANLLSVQNKVKLIQNDWANNIKGDFDLVIANPPYVSKEFSLSLETLNDPEIALFGDIQTYKNLLNSLKDIRFKQLLLEVPDYLTAETEDFIISLYKTNVSIYSIYDSGINCLEVLL